MGPETDTDFVHVHDAERILKAHVHPRPDTTVPLSSAAGHILREDLTADRDLPPFNRVTMDGMAIASAVWVRGCRTFVVRQVQPAGAPPTTREEPGEGIKVMTGAVLPGGTDCVIPQEYIHYDGAVAEVGEDAPVQPMQFVHAQGADARSGDLLVRRGRMLGAPETLLAAATGRTLLTVAHPPSVAVVSNGDELVPVAATPLPHQVRASNEHALCTALRERGITDLHAVHYPDNRDVMLEGLRGLLSHHDLVVLSGGISVGDYDYLPQVLRALEVRTVFARVRQRPGKPFWFGLDPEGTPVFALPGNPVSTLVCFVRYVRPWLEACMTGSWPATETAVLDTPVDFPPPLTRFLQVRARSAGDGRLLATPVQHHGSGDFASLSGTDGFVELDAATETFPAGYAAPFYRWR